jgi:hypothetical protein
MPRVGFEPTISVFEQAMTVHVLYRAATVIGPHFTQLHKTIEKTIIELISIQEQEHMM